jgi:uncharacterized protein (DUF885 family)
LVLSAAFLAGAAACSKPSVSTDPEAYALIDRIGRQELARHPELADQIGISPEVFGARYDTMLDDRSMAAVERARVQHLSGLEQLNRLDPATLSPAARRQVAIATASLDGAVRMERFGYGTVGLGWASPYIIDQIDGAWLETPRFLALHHTVNSQADAEAWLTRLKLLDDAIVSETRRFQGDLDQGISPPKLILERTLANARAQRPVDTRNYFLLNRFRDQLALVKDLPAEAQQRYLDEAALAVRNKVLPAYDELIKLLESSLAKAVDDPSVTRLPKGEEWYAQALRLYTNSDMTPEQVHSLGLSLVKEFSDEMNGILTETGKPEGSVGQRMQALAAEPARQYPDTEEGRTSLLAAIDAQITWAGEKLPRFVSARPKAKLTVRPAPQIAEGGSPGAYYVAASMDGARPATFYINLRTTLDWPVFALPTLTYHEALPGHHLQGGLAREATGAPLIQTLSAFPAYSEGWAVYAEDLASEMGAYDTEAPGRLGYLQSMLLRAARLVVDTGLHSKKWSRDQAIDYLVSTTGLPRAQMVDEVDRYIVWPGQACAYMVGREKIRALRDDADTELAQNFDLKSFNDAVLEGGSRPLTVLESDIRAWADARKPKPAAPASPK